MSRDRSWAPLTNHDQSCAFCGATRPTFAHRLNPAHLQFRLYGKGYTLPAFWPACPRCEALVAEGDDESLLPLIADQEQDDEARRVTLSAFRVADLGSEPLAEGPPDTVRP